MDVSSVPPPESPSPGIGRRWLALLVLGVVLGTSVVAVRQFVRRHGQPLRCRPGLVALGPRCCAPGQRLTNGACTGTPRRCPTGFHLASRPRPGCVIDAAKVTVSGGFYEIGANDWESWSVVAERGGVADFAVDRTETTVERWLACVEAEACPDLSVLAARSPQGSSALLEPGQPVVNVTEVEARGHCTWAGGYLPRRGEWLRLTARDEGYRYPWGQTGLVCRRASFGLVRGPCSEGARGPELAGSRQGGENREGVMDLSGNVAELVSDPEAGVLSLGGSYRSEVAAELKSWSARPFTGHSPLVGFRCAYLPPAIRARTR